MLKLRSLFLAMSLCATACDSDQAEVRINPSEMRAVGRMQAIDHLRCNFTVVGTFAAISSYHCNGSGSRFQIFDRQGNIQSAGQSSQVGPGSRYIRQMEPNLNPQMLNSNTYMDIARDSQIILLSHDLSAQAGNMSIMRLDRINWQPTQDPNISKADVFMFRHADTIAIRFFYRARCQIFRHNSMSQVIAHTCPASASTSGSPLTIQNADTTYSIAAIHQGYVVNNPENQLSRLFSNVITTPAISVAVRADSLADTCSALTNCRVVALPDGRFNLNLHHISIRRN